MAGYNVTKAGMLSLSETLYGELKSHNVGVTVICPSFFQTNLLNDGRLEKIDRDMASKMMKTADFTAEDVAERSDSGHAGKASLRHAAAPGTHLLALEAILSQLRVQPVGEGLGASR